MGKQVIQRANKSPHGHSRGAAMLPRTTREANRRPVQRCEGARLSWTVATFSTLSPQSAALRSERDPRYAQTKCLAGSENCRPATHLGKGVRL
jgi:hypothetical protein